MIKTHLSDEQLVSQYLSGSEVAIEALIKRHEQRIYSYIYTIVKDEHIANDVFQDTFIKIVRTLKGGKYNEEGKFINWSMRIAHNLSIDHFRHKKRMPLSRGGEDYDIFDTLDLKEESTEDKLIYSQIKTDIVKLVEYLPNDQKEVLKMRLYFEMSFKDIAEETNVSINTALGRMRYALINLRKMAIDKKIQLTMA
ncbi:MAG: RNA polymerase subunit sigma-24 [Crocinitomicaceae bacterium]|nr:RNA polymerase subunit sigma-24 [Crocinitomicaceae bacterium]|tara:strand:+ start:1888 stop:2475 length:588 start_codon:yes stop_codon:yes gene_type:complete